MKSKIDSWISNGQNVLFIGKHGVGKTAIVKEAFERHGLNYRYFSASTMDPWVDFIGVPKEKRPFTSDQMNLLIDLSKVDHKLAVEWAVKNWNIPLDSAESIVSAASKSGTTSYLELIKPESFASGEVEALFFDEFNRSPKKVRNAVMELLQFKSINGTKFPKLRLVWAAVNPEDDLQYDVERIDPAQKDRFHVHVSVPYRPSVEWFREKYGNRIADSAIQWWDDLEDNSDVSPRRLQYALDTYLKKGDMRDVLPQNSNVSKLVSALSTGPVLERLEELMTEKDEDKTTKFLANENNFSSAIKYILKSDALCEYFLPLCPKEKISSILSNNDKNSTFIIKNYHRFDSFKQVVDDVLKAGSNKSVVKKIRKHITESQFVLKETEGGSVKVFYSDNNDYSEWKNSLKLLSTMQKDSNWNTLAVLKIKNSIPKEILGADVKLCLELVSKLKPSPTDLQSSQDVWSNFVPLINHLILEGTKSRTVNSAGSFVSNPIPLKDFQAENVSSLSSLYLLIKLSGFEKEVIKNESQLQDVLRA